mgnify:CR=1 FL=1
MDLEQRVRTKVVVRRTPSNEVLKAVENGSRFVIVEQDFDSNNVPEGYTLVNMKYRNDSFRTLVPQNLLFYMANPGDGDVDHALEEMANFYGEVEGFEDSMIDEGKTSVQDVNWATNARETYRTYLVNKLVRPDGSLEDSPEFNPDALRALDLDDPYVAERIKVMASLALGKSKDEIATYEVKEVLKHYSRAKDFTPTGTQEQIGDQEFRKITKMRYKAGWDDHTKTMRCLGDSHYDLLPEFVNNAEWDFDLRTMTKTKKKIEWNTDLEQLERDITEYRSNKHSGQLGRHDGALLRMYANLAHIVRENPASQFDIQPPIKGDTK